MHNRNTGILLTQRFEGFSPKIYRDSLGNLSIGYGFNINDPEIVKVLPKDVVYGKRDLSQEEARVMFDMFYKVATNDAINFIGQKAFDCLSQMQQDILIDIAYNLGYNRLSKFNKLRAAIQQKDYQRACEEIKNSKWFSQVGVRGAHHYANFYTSI